MMNVIKQKLSILQKEREKQTHLTMEKEEQKLQERCAKLHMIMKTALDDCVKQAMDLENKNEIVVSYIFQDEQKREYTCAEMVAWMNKYNSSIGRTNGITIAISNVEVNWSISKFRCVIDKCITHDETLQIFLDIA
jgi:hypothetical protein